MSSLTKLTYFEDEIQDSLNPPEQSTPSAVTDPPPQQLVVTDPPSPQATSPAVTDPQPPISPTVTDPLPQQPVVTDPLPASHQTTLPAVIDPPQQTASPAVIVPPSQKATSPAVADSEESGTVVSEHCTNDGTTSDSAGTDKPSTTISENEKEKNVKLAGGDGEENLRSIAEKPKGAETTGSARQQVAASASDFTSLEKDASSVREGSTRSSVGGLTYRVLTPVDIFLDGDNGSRSASNLGKVSLTSKKSQKSKSRNSNVLPDNCGNLEFISRINDLPVVKMTCNCYKQIRENSILSAPLSIMELSAAIFFCPVRTVGGPVVRCCSLPVTVGDWFLCKCLDLTESVFPCITVPPNEMCRVTKDAFVDCVCCYPRAVEQCAVAVCRPDSI